MRTSRWGDSATATPSILVMTNSRSRPGPTSDRRAATAAPALAEIVERWQGLEGTSPAFQIDRRDAIDQDHERARGPLEWSAIVRAAARPGQRRAVRIRRIRRRQEVDRGDRRAFCSGLAHRPEAVDGAGQRELRGPEPLDEVAAPNPPRILERAQHRVDTREPANHVLSRDRVPDQDAVSVEEAERCRVHPLRG